MLLTLKADNCLIYDREIEFSMRADKSCLRFGSSCLESGGLSVLKTALVFGPNNRGKSNLVRLLGIVKAVMLDRPAAIEPNLFSGRHVCQISVSFLEGGESFVFEFRYDAAKREFVYERFAQVVADKGGQARERVILLRDSLEGRLECVDEKAVPLMAYASKTNILVHSLDTATFPGLDKMRRVLEAFASRIDIIDMNNIPIRKTLSMMRSSKHRQAIEDFMRNADLGLDGFFCVEDGERHLSLPEEASPQEEVVMASAPVSDLLRLVSVCQGVSLPSLFYDSTGTKKMAALAGYVLDALETGRILVVDELDSSLHPRLARALVAIFNNELNTRAQLVATVQDFTLLDRVALLRDDQIWLADRRRGHAWLYPLSALDEGRKAWRGESLYEQYNRGCLGAVPEPDLFKSLVKASARRLSLSGEERGKGLA